jgi:hypothetical protein
MDKPYKLDVFTLMELDERIEKDEKEMKKLRVKGVYYLEELETTDMFLRKLQQFYVRDLPIRGWSQTDILAVFVAMYMEKGE